MSEPGATSGVRTALVTGGGAGLGAAVVARLRAEGLRVLALDLDAGEGVDVVADVADPAGMAGVRAAVGPVDVLVNAAAVLGPRGALVDVEDEDWARAIEVGLSGTFHACRAFLPGMVAAGWGRVVNVASTAGRDGLADLPVFSAAAGGVLGLTKALGRQLAPAGVLVNAVAPDAVAEPPHERVAEVVAWLASERCSSSAGSVYDVS